MAEFDLVVRGGCVVDGTGAPSRSADVAVRDGLVVEVGSVSGRGRRKVDADGALVAPGFVDIHTHYDGQATWDSELAPSSWHGVTTVVMGNCGVGFAPVREADRTRLIELMEGVEDIPGTALAAGLTWEWSSFPDYLDAVARVPHDIDLAAQVPHAALRLHAMGDRGAAREPATPAEVAAMAATAREAVEAGALGFTTSRTVNHRTSTGEPTPTLTAAAEELVGIARGLGAAGLGVLQVVSDFADPDAEFALLRRMAKESGRPLSLSLADSGASPGGYRTILARIEQARADGLAVTAQVAARGVGLLLGLQCTLHPFMANPRWQELSGLSVAGQAVAMREPGVRERILAAAPVPSGRELLGGRLVGRFELMYPLGDPPDYEPDPSQTVAAQAARAGRTPEDLAYDTLVADEGRGMLYLPALNYVGGNLDAVGEMLAHPWSVPGLSDGGAHVGTICDGSFPTTLLTHWARDRCRGRLGLEFLVQRQCRDTAAAVGLHDRGVLAPGYRADLNVIDFDGLRLHRPEMRYDLPAGGKRLLQRASGYLHTFVGGTETRVDGHSTGDYPGRLVRGPQPQPA